MRMAGHGRLAIYLGAGVVLAGTSVGIGLSQSIPRHGTPRSAAGVTVPAAASTSQASAVSSASPSASASASTSVVISGGHAGTTTAPATGYSGTAGPPPAPGWNPPSPPPPCAPVLLDVSPVQVSIPLGPGTAIVHLTAECGAITWSAVAQPGVILNTYGGTLQAGGLVSLLIQESSTPFNVSYITINAGGAAINPGGSEVTVVNPFVIPPVRP